jgi:hypothetical protein
MSVLTLRINANPKILVHPFQRLCKDFERIKFILHPLKEAHRLLIKRDEHIFIVAIMTEPYLAHSPTVFCHSSLVMTSA